jgi:hypothetical protein
VKVFSDFAREPDFLHRNPKQFWPSLVVPTITWSNPSDITYGTALGNTQLDVTSSVPGNFTYNPQAGTVLSAGQNQQLTATLTPTDNVNYTTVSASVLIN